MAPTRTRLTRVLFALAALTALGFPGTARALELLLVYQGTAFPDNPFFAPSDVFYVYSLILDPGENIQGGDRLEIVFDNVAMNSYQGYIVDIDNFLAGPDAQLVGGPPDQTDPKNYAGNWVPRGNTTLVNVRVGNGTIDKTMKVTFYYTFKTAPPPGPFEIDYFVAGFRGISPERFNAFEPTSVVLRDSNENVKYRASGGAGDPGAPAGP